MAEPTTFKLKDGNQFRTAGRAYAGSTQGGNSILYWIDVPEGIQNAQLQAVIFWRQ